MSHVAGNITQVVPAVGPAMGTNPVTITGTGLGSGADITAVTLHGVPATIVNQTDAQVVVTAGAGNLPTLNVAGLPAGDVVVNSTSRGSTRGLALYAYNPGTRTRWLAATGHTYDSCVALPDLCVV